jgi:arylsulfatase A-like enzyme
VPPTAPLNILMLTLDAVRPDHLGCYGYTGVETPHIDALAREGILCQQAVTHAPNTWVSHATLFTGCLPPRHGLRAATHRLTSTAPTLAEWLSHHGYSTAAFPGSTLVGRPQGFHRGFDLFDECWWDEGHKVKEVLWRRNWLDTLHRAKKWIEEASNPFFLWLHYIDTHHLPEYTLPEYFRKAFPPSWQHYDGKISYADQICISKLMGFLEDCGLQDRTILFIFSDHGEELREGDLAVHDGGLHDDVVRVPLIISLPSMLGRSTARISEQVRLLDLFPTVCDLLNLPQPPGLQGRSLLTLLHGQALRDEEFSLAYLENWPKGYLGVRTSEWKLILRYPKPEDWGGTEPITEGIYHLPSDPEERMDLAGRHPGVVQYLRSACLKWEEGSRPQGLSAEDTARVETVLKGLGYL